MMWLLWVGIALVLGVIEMLTLDFIFLMMSIAAIIVIPVAALDASIPVQIVVFAVLALLLLFLVRPFIVSHFRKTTKEAATNVDAYLGKNGVVVATVNVAHGRIKVGGEVWTARSYHPQMSYAEGDVVTIVKVDGATAVVISPNEPPPAI